MKEAACLLGLWLAAGMFVQTGLAADHAIRMTADWDFNPAYLEIQVGDTVTWYNDDETFDHNARSDTDLWGTGDVAFEGSATLQFDTAGTYPYRDSLFFSVGMTGTIVVNAAALPPAPALLTAPAYLPDGKFRFTITNLTAGKTTTIETSTNLTDWIQIFTGTPAATSVNFTNSAIAASQFFRSFQLP